MNRAAQALALTALGGVALRLGFTDEHLNYVHGWMRWPLVVCGILLVGLAFSAVIGRNQQEEHATSPVAWVLILPVAIAFVIQPPALGAFVADRSSNKIPDYAEPAVASFVEGETNDIPVSQFVVMAATHGDELAGHSLGLTGFVTQDAEGWYVTRIAIRCCAADASAFRVKVEGFEAPPVEQWVEVSGAWVEGTGTTYDVADPPMISADELVLIDQPRNPYE